MAGQSADGPCAGGSASSVDTSTGGTVAIPGTKRRRYLEENIVATELGLTAEDITAVEAAAPTACRRPLRARDDGLVRRLRPGRRLTESHGGTRTLRAPAQPGGEVTHSASMG